MSEDPNIDKTKLFKHFKDNYTEQLKKLRMQIDLQKDEDYEETKLEKELRFTIKDELDDYDLNMIKQKRPYWIGVKPQVDTNRQKSKEELLLMTKKLIFEVRLKRKLKLSFIRRRQKDRIF